MNSLAAEPTHRPPDFRKLPAAVVGLLRDEANLSTAQQMLEGARHDCLDRLDELRRQRPALGMFAFGRQRDDHASALVAVQAQIAAIDRTLARVTAARDRLQGPLRAALLDHIQEADPLYRQGLRAGRFQEHWRRGHAVVADRLKAFVRDLRGARTAIAQDAARLRSALSDDSAWHLGNVRVAAAELENEIKAFNKAGEAYASAVAETPFARVHLPVLETWSCIQPTDTLAILPPAEAAQAVERLLTEFAELRQPSLDALSALLQAAGDEHTQIAESRLREYWSELLQYAECHLVTDAELEPILVDIERRQSAQERSALAAQHLDPFAAER